MTSHLLKNGRIDKYLFHGGYAQAYYFGNIGHRIKEGLGTADRNVTTNMNMKDDMHSTLNNISTFEPYFYNQDHLGNNREVVDNLGRIIQVTNYYPFGSSFCDSLSCLNATLQPYKYNGKEFDRMHGLNTYDYGARQYSPALPSWDRIDPLAEKYYNVSPYAYCGNNPVNRIDPNGMEMDWVQSDTQMKYDRRIIDEETAQLYYGKFAIYRPLGYSYIATTGENIILYDNANFMSNGIMKTAFDYTPIMSSQNLSSFVDFTNIFNTWGLGTIGGFGSKVYRRAVVSAAFSAQIKQNTTLVNRLDKLSGTYKYGRYATNFGWGLSVGVAVYRIMQGYEQDGGQIGYHTAKAASSSGFGLGFSIYGATHGATIGAGVGSWFGGIGAIPGSVIGSLLGGYCGEILGESVGENIVDEIYKLLCGKK